jgi:hypothetical protein
MVRYPDGTPAAPGDRVSYHGEAGTVDDVADTAEQQREWGVSTPGIFVRTPSFGLVFLREIDLPDDEDFEFLGPG